MSVTSPASAARSPASTTSLIAIAYSGGIDSTVLLAAAVRAVGAARCVALHVHHGLSPHADAWLEHARQCAANLGVSFASQRVSVDVADGAGVERAAREARYLALSELCTRHGAGVLLLGHHADDQVETVLLQMLRGAGLPGIAAMPAARCDAGGTLLLRPLLTLPRSLIETAAVDAGLAWIDDASNLDARFARNALRNEVLPALARHFPGYRDALARTARHAASAQRLIDALAREDLLRCAALSAPHAISSSALVALSEARAANVLRRWIHEHGMPAASTARLSQMLAQLRDADEKSAIAIHHAGHVLRCYRGRAYWELEMPIAVSTATALGHASATVFYRGQTEWRLPAWRGTLIFEITDDATAVDTVSADYLRTAPLSARSRRGGERMRRAAGTARRTLKNLFQEAGVPSWQRQVPLIFIGEQLLFVPGLGLDCGADVQRWRPEPVAHADDGAGPASGSASGKVCSEPAENSSKAAAVRLSWRPDASPAL
ncbi:MAG: tRNA lysidine(34) synthetase TilS [Janthinobacterium lividum]